MKKLLLLLLLAPMLLFGQNDDKPSLFEVVDIKVKMGQEKAFEAEVKRHNLAFHKEGTPYNAGLAYKINGPRGGTYSWIMGPTSFTAMDNRPVGEAHDESWNKVSQYIEDVVATNYWEYDPDMSFKGTDNGSGKSAIMSFDIKPGKDMQFKLLVAQVIKVYESQRPNETFNFYWNSFRDSKVGNDVAFVFPFSKWAWLDKEVSFRKDYEAEFGEGSYNVFQEQLNDCVIGKTEFIRETIK